MKKIVLLAFVLVFLSMFGTKRVITVNCSTTHHVHSGESIQDAIDLAQHGDTIIVHSGTYYETVIVDKIVSLIGKDKHNTIIDANGTGSVVSIQANHVTISNFTLQNGYVGIYSESSIIDTAISDNVICFNEMGIYFWYCEDNVLSGNTFFLNNDHGIYLHYSDNNTISGNIFCSTKGSSGIQLHLSNKNLISSNTILNDNYGLRLISSDNNKVIHNNFIDNTDQVIDNTGEANVWDDGYPSGGNYWSDYTGVDSYSGLYQNETDSDGIGDTPYFSDSYPLMKPYILSDEMLVCCYELLTKYNKLYSELQGNYDALEASYDNLQTDYTIMNSRYNSLNSSYNELTSKHEAIIGELNYIRNLMYVFIITTLIFIASTAYLAMRRPKAKPKVETT